MERNGRHHGDYRARDYDDRTAKLEFRSRSRSRSREKRDRNGTYIIFLKCYFTTSLVFEYSINFHSYLEYQFIFLQRKIVVRSKDIETGIEIEIERRIVVEIEIEVEIKRLYEKEKSRRFISVLGMTREIRIGYTIL